MFRCIIASAMFAAALPASAHRDETQDALPVSLCEVVAEPNAYADRLVRFQATIESDIHTALLLDANCSRGLRFNLKHAEPAASANAIEGVISSPDGTYGLQVQGEFVATVKRYEAGTYQTPYLLEISTIVEFSIRNR